MKRVALTTIALSAVATMAFAADTVDSLMAKVISTAEAASAGNRPVSDAVSGVIETSGATPVVVSETVLRLIARCPTGERARAVVVRPGVVAPAYCEPQTLVALRSARTIALAALASNPTGDTGNPLPIVPPPPLGDSGGSDYRPVNP
jgi:hypothetical protein